MHARGQHDPHSPSLAYPCLHCRCLALFGGLVMSGVGFWSATACALVALVNNIMFLSGVGDWANGALAIIASVLGVLIILFEAD